jgi:hypothetical protein
MCRDSREGKYDIPGIEITSFTAFFPPNASFSQGRGRDWFGIRLVAIVSRGEKV